MLDICRRALKTFEALGCIVEEALPDFPIDRSGGMAAAARLAERAARCSPYYNDPAKRALLKPEAMFEIESGLKLSAFDITAASLVRTRMVSSRAATLRALRLSRRPDRTAVSVRRRHALAERDRRAADGDLSRMDERRGSDHHVRLPGARRARGLQTIMACRSASRSSAPTMPSWRACNWPMPMTRPRVGYLTGVRRCLRDEHLSKFEVSRPSALVDEVRRSGQISSELVNRRIK